LAPKCLLWGYSAAAAGRFGENEITSERVTLAFKCHNYSAAPAGRFGENEITPK